MSFSLADIFAPTPALSGAAGGIVAPGTGDGSAFADALKAFRAGAFEGAEGADGTPDAAAALDAPPAVPAGPLPALATSMLALVPQDRIAELGLDDEALLRIESGASTARDMEKLVAALAPLDLNVAMPVAGRPVGEAGTDMTVPAAVVAATASAGAGGDAGESGDGQVEMALRIANDRPAYVPPKDKLDTTPQGAAANKAAPVLREGRASAAGAAAALMNFSVAADNGDAPQVSRAVMDALAPRAPVPPVASQPAAPALPPAAQAIAATPHVTSLQGQIVKDEAAETPPRPQTAIAPKADASTPPANDEAVPAPQTGRAANAAAPLPPTNAAAVNPALADSAKTEQDAADAALNVLTKGKDEAKLATAQTQTQTSAHAKSAPQEPDLAASKPAPDAAPKSAPDAKPQMQAAEKPAATEKPAAPEPRAAQTQPQQSIPMPDRIALADPTGRAVQQAMHQPQAVAIPHIAGEMAARFRQGQTRFEIRLDPPELGRVDVRIEVDGDGRVHSRLMVEKSETLDLLKADQRALERALHDAGFKSEQNTLSFSLRDERGGQNARYDQQRNFSEMNVRTEPDDDPARLAAELAYRAPMRGPGGVDLRV